MAAEESQKERKEMVATKYSQSKHRMMLIATPVNSLRTYSIVDFQDSSVDDLRTAEKRLELIYTNYCRY